MPFCVQFHIVYNLVADRTERGVFFLEDDRRVVGVLKSKLTGLADVFAKSVLEQTNNILSSSTKWLGSPGEIRLLSRIYPEWPELFLHEFGPRGRLFDHFHGDAPSSRQ